MSTTTYTLDLSDIVDGTDSFTQTIQAGNLNLSCVFQWPTEIQEQYDAYLLRVTQAAQTDPIKLTNGSYNRDYDYVDYYASLANVSDLSAWLAAQTELPVSLSGQSLSYQLALLQTRIDTCVDLQAIFVQFKEDLCWQVTITENTDITIASVILGGWYRNQDSTYAFRFVSDGRTDIGKNDLTYVTMECEVYE